MKNLKLPKVVVIGLPILLLTSLILFAYLWWKENTKAFSDSGEIKSFIIKKGTSAEKIANNLVSSGLIKSALAFKIYVQLNGKASNIPAGEYDLSPSLSLVEIINSFSKGPTQIWVTIPEGMRKEEIVERFIKSFQLNDEKEDTFRQEFEAAAQDKEGYLFPDTYLFAKTATGEGVVKKMLFTFDTKAPPQVKKSDVILASILERETKTNEERPIVAGILLKRLTHGWPLQADATIQYVVGHTGNWWPVLTKDDLNIKSSYNTYARLGFPPTPIANPGLSSLEAAIYPTETAYWYYIHDPEGKIHYATTLEEHNGNIRRFLKNSS